MLLCLFPSSILFFAVLVACSSEDGNVVQTGYCDVDQICNDERHNKLGSRENDTKPRPYSSHYNILIEKQWLLHPLEEEFPTCEEDSRSCVTPFDDVIEDDLSVWREMGGISQTMFEESKQLGVHYQVIGGKLYRQKECMFGPRCRGVEHFLLEVIDDLPDVEMLINVFDWPKVRLEVDDRILT